MLANFWWKPHVWEKSGSWVMGQNGGAPPLARTHTRTHATLLHWPLDFLWIFFSNFFLNFFFLFFFLMIFLFIWFQPMGNPLLIPRMRTRAHHPHRHLDFFELFSNFFFFSFFLFYFLFLFFWFIWFQLFGNSLLIPHICTRAHLPRRHLDFFEFFFELFF